MPRSPWKPLLLLLLAALVLRAGWVLTRPMDEASLASLPDQTEYLACARTWLSGGPMACPDAHTGQIVYAQRTPGYPAFIATLGTNLRLVRLAQCLLDVSTVLAVYFIARRWLSERRSLLAAGIVAVNPFLVFFCGLLLTETLYISLIAWSILLMLHRRWVLVGIFLAALGVLVRPSGIGLALALPLAIGGLAGQRRSFRRGLLFAAVSLLVLAAVLFPWARRNHALLGEWVWLSTNGGITLYDGLHPRTTGASDLSFVKTMPEFQGLSEVQRDQRLSALAHAQLRADPARALLLGVKKTLRTWSPIPLSEQYGNRLYVLVGLFYSLPVMLLWLTALRFSMLPARVRLLLVVPALTITAMHFLSVGSLRYRMPAEPMLAILAASWGSGRDERDQETRG